MVGTIRPELYQPAIPETYWAVGPFGDIDNSHTKSLLLDGTAVTGLASFRELAVGKRPEYELYDLRSDPWQVSNVSGHQAYRRIQTAVEISSHSLDEANR